MAYAIVGVVVVLIVAGFVIFMVLNATRKSRPGNSRSRSSNASNVPAGFPICSGAADIGPVCFTGAAYPIVMCMDPLPTNWSVRQMLIQAGNAVFDWTKRTLPVLFP